VRRIWNVEVGKVSSAVLMKPTAADLKMERQLEWRRIKRAEGLNADPNGLGIYGEETMDEIVRRQNKR
jgi:hypothetical protein